MGINVCGKTITFFFNDDDDDANDYLNTTCFCIFSVQPLKKLSSPELNPQNNTRQSAKRA